ncbi:MAG: hypothetical protein KTR32_07710 [Granulosicoccus sp.]|nr:hypothetical protein [Granulosicoccus sp.]
MRNQLSALLAEQPHVLTYIAGISMLLLIVSIIATPWIISRLPTDYLLQSPRRLIETANPVLLFFGLLRNIMAAVLLVMGLIMLITPGPGLVMLLLAIGLARVPGKHRLLQRLASRESVFHSLNRMRRRYKKPPLIHPDAAATLPDYN